MDLIKIQLKLVTRTRFDWLHFCYIPKELKREFDRKVNRRGLMNNDWVSIWANAQFGLPKIKDKEALDNLKKAIHEYYRDKYPDIYIENPSKDIQGWARIWMTENMTKELEKCQAMTK